ncbi:MAG TPA: ABC transporter ATP-binding protein, partial [Ilumatobacteraceae bacterium]|nr:ABC transporter ATP-binding protein [Ilumatobacteraceae bacterium]
LRIAGILQAILTLASLVPFVLLAEVGRRLLDGQSVDDQWSVVRLALVVLGVATTLSAALMLWLHLIDARFALDVRRRLLAKLARLPLGWFTERNAAAVQSAVADDTATLHYYVTHAAVDVIGAIVAPLAVLVYLFVVDAGLAAVLLIPVVAYVFVFASMMQASGSKIGEAQKWAQRMNGEATAYLDGLPVVRVFGGAGASGFRRSVGDYVGFLRGWQGSFVSKKATASLITDPLTFLAIIVVIGGAFLSAGWIDAAGLLPFLLLGTTFGPRLLALAYNAGGLRGARAAAQRIGLTLTEPELDVVTGAAIDATGASADGPGEVRFEGVAFEYRPGVAVLSDIDLHLVPGTVTALVGPSGSGKSTLAALVARFHDPQQGSVRIGGRDVRELAPDDLYRQ